jgi:hypothetical protein
MTRRGIKTKWQSTILQKERSKQIGDAIRQATICSSLLMYFHSRIPQLGFHQSEVLLLDWLEKPGRYVVSAFLFSLFR